MKADIEWPDNLIIEGSECSCVAGKCAPAWVRVGVWVCVCVPAWVSVRVCVCAWVHVCVCMRERERERERERDRLSVSMWVGMSVDVFVRVYVSWTFVWSECSLCLMKQVCCDLLCSILTQAFSFYYGHLSNKLFQEFVSQPAALLHSRPTFFFIAFSHDIPGLELIGSGFIALNKCLFEGLAS